MAKSIQVKPTGSPFADRQKTALLERINSMNPTELKNMEILMKSKKANAMISKENGLAKLKIFL